MDATRILEADHQKIRGLFELIREAGDAEEKRTLFREIKDEIELHTGIEEEVFYPVFSKMPNFHEIVRHSLDEHHELRDILEDIDEAEDLDEVLDQIELLRETFEQHVTDEEKEFFPMVRKTCNDSQLGELALKLELAKNRRQLMAA